MTSLRRSNALYIKRNALGKPKTPTRMPRSVLVDGAERVEFPHGGTSQYDEDETSASACGLAALNFARIVFSMEQGGLQDIALLQAVMAPKCTEEATAICTLWSGNVHLDIEDTCRIPLFEKTLKMKKTTYGLPGVTGFTSLLTGLNNFDSSAVAIITRYPGTIACLKLRVTSRNVFIIFDSYPRPSYPNGYGVIASTSIEGTARRLTEILRNTVRPTDFFLDRPVSYSGHVFVPHGVEASTSALSQAALASSLAQLSNGSLKGEQQSLEREIKDVEPQNRLQKILMQRRRQRQLQQQPGSPPGPSDYFDQPYQPSATPRHVSSLMRLSSHLSSPMASTSTLDSCGSDSPSVYSSSVFSDYDDSAMRPQHEFDVEDSPFSALRAEFAKSTQRLFTCGICLEELPEDSIARPDPCGHTFCRECLREHVTTRLGEHRFPILCPTCTASKGKGKGVAGEVSQALALDLGLNDEQYGIWTEMEMAAFSILLHCRKCQRSMFVARDEHEEVDIVTCPLPDCRHAWCKQCQQSIDFSGPKHSCDGSSELDHLMKKKGWKYCPTCKTPIQKVSGCNHMSCRTPACNTHFCYNCGGLIVRSALGREIAEAISAHFRKYCKQ